MLTLTHFSFLTSQRFILPHTRVICARSLILPSRLDTPAHKSPCNTPLYPIRARTTAPSSLLVTPFTARTSHTSLPICTVFRYSTLAYVRLQVHLWQVWCRDGSDMGQRTIRPCSGILRARILPNVGVIFLPFMSNASALSGLSPTPLPAWSRTIVIRVMVTRLQDLTSEWRDSRNALV